MIRYILVDDNPKVLERVKAKIDTINNDYQLKHVGSFNSSRKAFEEVNELNYDLLIVDYEMPVYNGIELAKKIASKKKIIFLTSTLNNEKEVINSLDISGYLSKPFEIDEFQEILKNKVIGKIDTIIPKQDSLITLSIGNNNDIRFASEKVYYITSKRNNGKQPAKNCVNIYTKNDELLFNPKKKIRKSIRELKKELSVHNFEQINQSTIINIAHIKSRDNTHIELYDCKEGFVISSKEKEHFLYKLKNMFKF